MSRSHRRNKRFKLRSFYVWHRYMGVSAALFVLVIATTGLMLNHTEDFAFDSRFVQSSWMLDWYGIDAPDALQSFSTGEHQVTLLGEQLYCNYRQIPGTYRELAGIALLHGMLVVAADGDLLMLTPDGDLIERLQREDGIPEDIRQLGSDSMGNLFARTDADIYESDTELLRWTEWNGDADSIKWSMQTAAKEALVDALQQRYRGRILPLERVILDLHSGRLFGSIGVWLFDIAAILLILLALSGTLIWMKRKR